jgi:vancomycin resistance protein YoaR
MTRGDAKALLQSRFARIQAVPVSFSAGDRTFKFSARTVGVQPDWDAAIADAAAQGGGVGFLRGYRRLELQLFPADVAPPIKTYDAALDYELSLLAKATDTPHREAYLVRRGLHITIAPGATGRQLDTAAARQVIVDSLASFSRAPVMLPVRLDTPAVTVASLSPRQRRATTIISAGVTLDAGTKRLRIPRWRLAKLLDLETMRFEGPAADAYFAKLERQVDMPARDAQFAISGSRIRVVPSQSGLTLDVPRSVAAVLAAASRPANRVAKLTLAESQPKRTTAQAQAMGITGIVGSYETLYGGDANRVHNVQLVAHLVDKKLIAPGATFSFNGTTGERTAAKGFQEAPVIINGELQNGLGGGICQVSTTVFNAAFDAGLPITARTNHALYISHYPLGRDATVNYPDLDLRFVNDSDHWLLLRTFVGSGSLTVNLYGTALHRHVESETEPLVETGAVPVKEVDDPTLDKGKRVTDEIGAPPRQTSVHRLVYDANGKLLYDNTWRSYYVGEPTLVRVGTKAPAKKKKPAKKDQATVTTPAMGDAPVGGATSAAKTPTATTPASTTTPTRP